MTTTKPSQPPVSALITIQGSVARIATDDTKFAAANIVPGYLLPGDILWEVYSLEGYTHEDGTRYGRAVPHDDGREIEQ